MHHLAVWALLCAKKGEQPGQHPARARMLAAAQQLGAGERRERRATKLDTLALLDTQVIFGTAARERVLLHEVEPAQRAGARFRQVSVRHYSRQFGTSQFFRPARILKTYADLA
ncbi:MAG: hypothetical protein ABW321_27140, partial [Polyangiales bacterium]